MAALTGSDLRYTRRRVGSLPVDADLQTIYDAFLAEGVEQPLEWMILEVLETRLAELIRNPATFSVAGEYSQSTSENIKALKEQIESQRMWMASLGIVLDSSPGAFTIVHAEAPAFRR
jgi:hypothetical protein